MNAKQLRGVQKKHSDIMSIVEGYVYLARGCNLSKEDDYNDLEDAVMTVLLEEKGEGVSAA